MAGTTRILKDNEILFKQGDPPDHMYIVRKGRLTVYFTKGNETVNLAEITEGAIVGEMAFFDDKPRSASVRAVGDAEVLTVSKADFDRLLTQVPRWMVTMMQSLVSRLRSTNEKVQALEAAVGAGGQGEGLILPRQRHPFQHVVRIVKLLLLGVAKDGQKDGREFVLPQGSFKQLWSDFGEDSERILTDTLKVLIKNKLLTLRAQGPLGECIVFPNRGSLANFANFAAEFARNLKPLEPFLSAAAMDLFTSMVEAVTSSGYETLNIALSSHIANSAAKYPTAPQWKKAARELVVVPELKAQTAGEEVSFRVTAKDHRVILGHLRILQELRDAKLA